MDKYWLHVTFSLLHPLHFHDEHKTTHLLHDYLYHGSLARIEYLVRHRMNHLVRLTWAIGHIIHFELQLQA